MEMKAKRRCPTWLLAIIFGWAGLSAVAGEFEFVVMGDTRPRLRSEDFRVFRGLIDKVNEAKPAFVINVGDLIYGYGMRKKSQWDKYEQVIKAFQAPYYQLPGNHDTFSQSARREYARRFGKFYYSFNHVGCHFVLLDSCERTRWGYIGPAQLQWLKADLKANVCRPVFIFTHFPLWEQDRMKPAYFDTWLKTLHPLFRESGVLAVFGGHYHCYGPTIEMDGIQYFITGGGGAELLPDYRKAGGEHHFVKVKVSGERAEVRVATSRGDLSDAEADIMGGFRFADRHSSRIGIAKDPQELRNGLSFSVVIENPYREWLAGKAEWRLDPSVFTVSPQTAEIRIPPQGHLSANFAVTALTNRVMLQSLPWLEFNVAAGASRHRFQRQLLFLGALSAGFADAPPKVDGSFPEWVNATPFRLGAPADSSAEVRALHDRQNLYLAVSVPAARKTQEESESSADDLLIGLAARLNDTDFTGDKLRLGLTQEGQDTVVRDRTPGHAPGVVMRQVRAAGRRDENRVCFEIAIPRALLAHARGAMEGRLVLSLSFAGTPAVEEPPEADATVPEKSSFAYQVRFGGEALIPVYFAEVKLEAANKRR